MSPRPLGVLCPPSCRIVAAHRHGEDERALPDRPGLEFRSRGWDLLNADGQLVGYVWKVGDTPTYLCTLLATDEATCVSGKGETREQAVDRAYAQRAAFADTITALVEGDHREDQA